VGFKAGNGRLVQCGCEAPKPGTNPGDYPCQCPQTIWYEPGKKVPVTPICDECSDKKHKYY
jgi:hypothetical protein